MLRQQLVCRLEQNNPLGVRVVQLAGRVAELLLHLVVVGLIEVDVKSKVDSRSTHGCGQQLGGRVAHQCRLDAGQVAIVLLEQSLELFQVEHSHLLV